VRYYLIDEGAFGVAELAGRDGLPTLLFRLESSPDPAELVAVADAVLAWLGRHPGFIEARTVFAQLLGAMMARPGPDIRVPEDLLEVRNMLATRVERWKQDLRLEGLQAGRQEGRQKGEAALLLRLLERRFGPLSDGVPDRVLAADTATLEEWGVRVFDAGTLAEVLM
jgi:hypothetical protein